MKFITLDGRTVNKNITKYRIDFCKKSRSNYQFRFKKFLEPFVKNHIVFEEFPVVGTRLSIDIFDLSKKIAYEVQGEFHYQFNAFFHGSRIKYRDQMKRDVLKEKWCKLNNILLIEIFPEDLDVLSRQWFIDKYNIDLI